jgi:hypothetical protein
VRYVHPGQKFSVRTFVQSPRGSTHILRGLHDATLVGLSDLDANSGPAV